MADLMDAWPAARAVLARRGMACVGCAMAPFEAIAGAAGAAAAYGFDSGRFTRDVMDGPASSGRPGRRKNGTPRHITAMGH